MDWDENSENSGNLSLGRTFAVLCRELTEMFQSRDLSRVLRMAVNRG